jgi:hypothetical protein
MSYDNPRYGQRARGAGVKEILEDLEDFICHCAEEDLRSEAQHVIALVRFSEYPPEMADNVLCDLYAEIDRRQEEETE